MGKVDEHRSTLRSLGEWDAYLLAESGLPGPRASTELARGVAMEGSVDTFRRYAAYDAWRAPVNSQHEFLAFCGVLGLGRLIAEGDRDLIS